MPTPDAPDELTAEWLTSVLRTQDQATGDVSSFTTELLGGEQGITGQLARLRVRYAVDAPGLPHTFIAKFSAPDPATRSVLIALGHYEREVRFYQLLSASTPVVTPRCYYSHLDPGTGSSLLLFEDLAHARAGNSIAGCSLDEVARVVVELARLHAAWWDAGDLAGASWLRLRHLLAPEAVAGAFRDSWPAFLPKLSVPKTSRISEAGDWIAENLPAATTTLFDHGPRTLIHNDVQADNLFFGSSEQLIFIDWQMVTYARCVVDVAGWIRGQLEPEIRREAEPRLLRLYHDALVAHGVHDYGFDQCLADYRLATVLAPARLACAVGMSDGLQAHPGAFWDTLFPRYPD